MDQYKVDDLIAWLDQAIGVPCDNPYIAARAMRAAVMYDLPVPTLYVVGGGK